MPTDVKRQAVAELAELLRTSSAMAVVDYRGLKVSDMQSVRRTLRDSGVQLTIAKNRLLKIAADEADRTERLHARTVRQGHEGGDRGTDERADERDHGQRSDEQPDRQ